MKEIERDEDRERRIEDEAIIDAFGPEEQALVARLKSNST
jgi:hypothetical protein